MKDLRHYFTHFKSLGGVQSILRSHLSEERIHDIPASLGIFFDTPNASSRQDGFQVDSLGWSGWTSIAQARRSFLRSEGSRLPHTVIFHDLWGLAFLADLAPCQYRMGAIHSHWPGLEYQLTQVGPWLDGVFCDSHAIADVVMERVPHLNEERAVHLPVPIQTFPDTLSRHRPPLAQRPIRLGFVGRVDHEQKRVERFIPLLAALDQSGLDYTMDFLGSGNAEGHLKKMLEKSSKVTFHGRQSGDPYWRILAQWDCVIYTSDFEGSPLAMQEALNAGCLPIYPRIHSGGDLVVQEVYPDGLYSPEDYPSIALTLSQLSQTMESEIEVLRQKAISVSQEYAQDKYHLRFRQFWEAIISRPPVANQPTRRRHASLLDQIPMGMLHRLDSKALFRRQPLF